MKTFTGGYGWTASGICRLRRSAGALLLCLWAQRAPGFAGGDGSAIDPYRIATPDHLEAVNSNLTAHYTLKNDLDLDGRVYERAVIAPFVDASSALFAGSFDGNGNTIRNLTIEGGDHGYLGLFGRIAVTGTVAELVLDNVDIRGAGKFVGGVAGWNRGGIVRCRITGMIAAGIDETAGIAARNDVTGHISGCYGAAIVRGEISVGGLVGVNLGLIESSQALQSVSNTGAWPYAGGIAGYNGGTIRRCFARGDVTTLGNHAGGLAGLNVAGEIRECYARGAVSATGGAINVGGLVGRNYQGAIVHCYATGPVTGPTSAGGLVGTKDTGGGYADTANFWDRESTGILSSSMGTGKSGVQMRTLTTFTAAGWDFADIWSLDSARNNGYPHLQPTPPAAAARPGFDPGGGVFGDTFALDVTVACATTGASVHYTLDGGEPTEGAPALLPGGVVSVTLPATLRARTWAMGMDPSPVHEAFFDGRTASGVHFSWLLPHGYALNGSDDSAVPPGKTQDVRTHFFADLDPTDPGSVFRMLGLKSGVPVTVTFEPASSARVYTLESCDDVRAGDWQPVAGAQRLPGAETGGRLEESEAGAVIRFYRVTADLP